MRTALLVSLTAACGGATARLQLSNDTATPRQSKRLDDGTSLRIKLIAVYLAQDVDAETMNNVGDTEMVWLNPECNGDISGCNIDGFALPQGPRITSYFDLARSTAEVNAELSSQDAPVSPGTYRYARIEMCKAYGQSQADKPTLMWAAPGMTGEQPFTSGDCGRTSLPFDPPLQLATGDSVAVTLGYDLSKAIVEGPPAQAGCTIAGEEGHCYRACMMIDATTNACMDYPDFAPSAVKEP